MYSPLVMTRATGETLWSLSQTFTRPPDGPRGRLILGLEEAEIKEKKTNVVFLSMGGESG